MKSYKISIVIASLIIGFFLLSMDRKVAFSQSLEWVSESSMLTARDQFTGGVINGKIYVFGGNGNPDGFNLKSTEMFDPSTHLWTYKSSNENNGGQGVEELSGAVLNDKLYVFGAEGGGTPYGVFNFVQEYDPATDTWTSKAPKPTVVSGATAAVYNDEIFLFGGGYSNSTSSRVYYDVVEAYNPISNTWRTVTNMPYNLGHMSVSVVGTKAYLIGGYDRNTSELLQNIIAYDFEDDQWITNGLGVLSTPRLFYYSSSAPIVDGKIYLVGWWTNVGWNFTDPSDASITNEVEVYDPSTQSFNPGPSLPQATDDFLALSINNSIYVLGGQTDWENSISTNAVLRIDLAPKPNITPIISLLLDDDPDKEGVWLLTEVLEDHNNDGSIDHHHYMYYDDNEAKGNMLYDLGDLISIRWDRTEVDDNNNGTIDRVTNCNYDSNGRLETVNGDNGNDGTIDDVTYYNYDSNGKLLNDQLDLGNDGDIDDVFYYNYDSSGKLLNEQQDWDNDGDIDDVFIIIYDSNGRMVAIENDWYNNGTIDEIDHIIYDSNGNWKRLDYDEGRTTVIDNVEYFIWKQK